MKKLFQMKNLKLLNKKYLSFILFYLFFGCSVQSQEPVDIWNIEEIKKIKNVISLGGGGIINTKIKKEVLANHFSFWLDCDESILIKRIKNSKKRPLAFKSTHQEIKGIIKNRSKIYSNAQFKINCNKLTKTEIVKKIIKIYELN